MGKQESRQGTVFAIIAMFSSIFFCWIMFCFGLNQAVDLPGERNGPSLSSVRFRRPLVQTVHSLQRQKSLHCTEMIFDIYLLSALWKIEYRSLPVIVGRCNTWFSFGVNENIPFSVKWCKYLTRFSATCHNSNAATHLKLKCCCKS